MSVRRVAAPLVAAALAVVALTGCTSGGPASGAAAASSGSAPPPVATLDPTPVPAVTATEIPTVSPAPSEDPDGDAPVLVLQGDGLGLLGGDDSPAPLLFGVATAEQVGQELGSAIGDVVSVPLACPQGPRTGLQADGFTALLDGDRLVGWTDAGAPDRSTTTADGIGVGSSLGDLQSAVPDAQLQAGADGVTTFTSAGGLSGALSGGDPAATLTGLSAGQTCPGAG